MMVGSAEQGGANASMSPTFFISAGEASGEQYGALLIAALKERLKASGQTGRFLGMGGARMVEAGLEPVARSEDMAVMGLTEVLGHLPRVYWEFRKLKQSICDPQHRPDVAVLIDFPDIHFRLAKEFQQLGVPVVFFVSPQLWAWKKNRIELVKKYVSRMLVIFPFEEPFYREHGVAAEFVGHPLAELPLPSITREEFAAANGLDAGRGWIGLLPGSRPTEIGDNLPEMLSAARGLAATGFQFLVPLAATLNAAQREEVKGLVEVQGEGLDIRLVEDARATLLHARASVVASGTATVEAALMGNPFVVVYRVSHVTFAIAKRVVKVEHVAMVNLIAGKRIVPELIQSDFTAANIVQQIEPLLPDGAPRQSMMKELAAIRGLLNVRPGGQGEESKGAIGRVAAVALEVAGFAPPALKEDAVRG
jgi:lipid-A-disaccharide synthase